MSTDICTTAYARSSHYEAWQGVAISLFVAKRYVILMYVRFKKFIGTFVLVILIIGYALAAMIFAETQLTHASTGALFMFFAVTGVLWILPAMGLIWWMEKKPKG